MDEDAARQRLPSPAEIASMWMRQWTTLGIVASRHIARMAAAHGPRAAATAAETMRNAPDLAAAGAGTALGYAFDRAQRGALWLDLLRERGDRFLAHEAAGCPPVLAAIHETVMDGRDLPRPCNYRLLRLYPCDGTPTIEARRPYVIIDPRAGHGPGVGGFKHDSQAGLALSRGHPVYLVAFGRDPEPGQTLADVIATQAAFVREVMRRHPDSARPLVIGNCQGGWGTLLMAATNTDLCGPVVLNGAPVAYWSGRLGEHPMRYLGGLMGGLLPARLLADLGGGRLDGAWLVTNFEWLNPARNFLTQYLDVIGRIDDPDARAEFLDFQRWWGGYFAMTAAEIDWIVGQLFLGNRLTAGEGELAPGVKVDLRAIRAPIIVFTSRGDNITPPAQALNWITDVYGSEQEIVLCGQRIVYMVHETVGHLGIFVASSVARREHAEMGSTMKTIEALAPGLYEMTIEDTVGEGAETRFVVAFHQRRLADIAAMGGDRGEEVSLAAVARSAETLAAAYDNTVRPFLRDAVPPAMAEAARWMQPLRAQRWAFASANPLMAAVAPLAVATRASRRPVTRDNPLARAEAVGHAVASQMLDGFRDARDMGIELAFHMLWGHPAAVLWGRARDQRRPRRDAEALRQLPQVQQALARTGAGGFAEAVIRMLILLADARGSVRRDRLERSARVLSQESPFAELGAEARAAIIAEQSVIARIDPDAAIGTLPKLLRLRDDRRAALAVVLHILGPTEEMEGHTVSLLARFRAVLGDRSLSMLDAAE